MKKNLCTLAGLFLTVSLSAQTLVNGDFEAAITPVSIFGIPVSSNLNTTTGWGGFFKSVSTSPGQGAQSVVLETVSDPAVNLLAGWGSDTIPGLISQSISPAPSNSADLLVSYVYKYEQIGLDQGLFGVQIVDTMLADVQGQPSDDVVMYYGFDIYPASVTSWTPSTIVLTATGNMGTPNLVQVVGCSSAGLLDASFPTPSIGSKLYLDNVTFDYANVQEMVSAFGAVYPNPAVDELTVTFKKEVSVLTIYSTEGKFISQNEISGWNATIDISELQNGMYILEATDLKGNATKSSFIKK